MPTHPLMQYLESEIFFPVLNAVPENFPDKQQVLESAQMGVIDMLHNLYYPCATPEAMRQTIVISLMSPDLRPIWDNLHTLGFLKMTDGAVHLG